MSLDNKNLRYIFSSPGLHRAYCSDYYDMIGYRTKDNACIVFDGHEIILASEAERFTKIKHDFGLPVQPLLLAFASSPNMSLADITEIRDGLLKQEHDHHECHMYEVFYQSGFEESAILVNDGCGDRDDSITLGYMRANKDPLILKKFPKCNSLCTLYAIAAYSTFSAEFSEGKFMGLAAYGKDNGRKYAWFDQKEGLIGTDYGLVKDDLRMLLRSMDGNPVDVMHAKDVAFTVQKNFEDVVVKVVQYFKNLLKEHGIETDNLCMSGGGILNCPTNSRIIDLGLFKHYYASPQPSDGCAESIGRAYKYFHMSGETIKPQRLKTPYLGLSYDGMKLLHPTRKFGDKYAQISAYLNSGGIVAWYQGGAEYGPRALGHRSFLADPTRKEMLDLLNKVKGREPWRPLAPIVPDRLFHIIFETKNTDMCEYMLRTLPIREKWRPRLQAVCHADGTTRPQLLKREMNPELYDLLMKYFESTGIPCLVNTSLNIKGFPIVETLRDLCDLQDEIVAMDEEVGLLVVLFYKDDCYEVGINIPD